MTYTTKRDTYQEVTDTIVKALESGTSPWRKPWTDKAGAGLYPYNAESGRAYNGINVLLLFCTPYTSRGWLTFKQAKRLGGSVREGEKGTHIVYWNILTKPDPADKTKTKKVFILREYTVFNTEQCEGLDAKKIKLPTPPINGNTSITALAEQCGTVLKHGGNSAYYVPSADYIQMPSADQFKDTDNYDATLAHEMTHWTGHKSRLDRDFSGRFGDEAYAFEELVAEIGSAFVCANMGIDYTKLQHPSYLASWLRVLKNDKRAIITAATKATKACEFILSGGKPKADEFSDSVITTEPEAIAA